ncbi:unnamed protein product [Urochloa decumbens]|uniref:FBD domain-containing protein n=1 Tax=Urochloa decumbens TaxID=240449 RepID=A0ABC9FPM1_9POAL
MGMVTRAKKRRMEEESRRPDLPPKGGADLISRLPDDVPGKIISAHLPAKDGGRTQILSRRWRPLWRLAPLNFEAKISGNHPVLVARTFSQLLTHKGPVRRFFLDSRSNYDCLSIIDSILGSPRFENLQEFELLFDNNGHRDSPIPRSVFCLSPTLQVLRICSTCEVLQFPVETACVPNFPHLKQLTLSNINISESTLHGLLARCPVLENLVLSSNRGYHCVRISSLTLRSLGISDAWFCKEGKLDEIIIEDAPLLERFIPCKRSNDDLVIRVIQAPKLKILGYLSHKISRLDLGTLVFQKLVPGNLSNVMRTVKILALDIAPDLSVVIDFLKCFPCVTKLYIAACQGNFMNERRSVSLECLDLHLKVVQYINYDGEMSEVNFIKFFVLNAKVLESMKFVARRDKCDAKWIQKQHKLWLNARASQGYI